MWKRGRVRCGDKREDLGPRHRDETGSGCIREEIARQQEEIEALKKALKEQHALIDTLNSKIDRIESFLRSFK